MTGVSKHNQEERNIIDKNNIMFDNKLKQKGLIDFIRKSDYIKSDIEIKLFHIKCGKEMSVKPDNFFKRKHKCLHCYKKELKTKKKAVPKNDFFQNKINILTNNEFKLLSDYYNAGSYVKLKHIVCGHIFETRADNFEMAQNKCPKCANRNNINNKTISQKIKELENLLDNQYEILTKVFTCDDNIIIRHKYCGEEFKCSVSSILKLKNKKRITIKCPKCNLEDRKEDFLDKLDRIQNNEFAIKSKYRGMYTPMTFYHKKCRSIFKAKPVNLLVRKVETCPACREDSREKKFKEKLKSTYNNEFELISEYESSDKKIILKHKKCGSSFEIFPTNLFNGNYPCKECSKKMKALEKKEKYVAKIKDIYNGKFTFTGEYLGVKSKTEFTCNLCNNTFEDTLDKISRGKRKCPHCRQ